ncbi:MAG: arylsulfatase [candidate division WS1 bacterium]|nr:arylsulfatase [candidate division WS1 bacterium]
MPNPQPNVILVITDDQGYADLGCTGNPWIQTPNIDAFHEEALRLTDFHVSPLCTPTRGALMTGHRPLRNGAWATCWGRSLLREEEVTMAEVFAHNEYRTGMFGKWHLGDNYPYRPFDRGFQTVVAHKGGGVGQTPDFWGNNYFDDTYFHNGAPRPHEGYCTDIWFEQTLAFIEANADQPFFAYLATNAPHSPYLVAERYQQLYAGNPDIPEPAFYGMITNIDENFGRLRRKLVELDLEENTILVFMTDNGSSGSAVLDENHFPVRGYNAGMRGMKGSYYDGGHRVPFFLRWPQGGIGGGRDLGELTLHLDVLPTLVEMCSLELPRPVAFDGQSLGPLLRGETETLPGDRLEFVQYRQATEVPEKWTNAVVTRRWRLIHGQELYDIQADPGQTTDVADQYPEVVARLREAHEQWWEEVSPQLEEYCPITIGSEAENPTRLDAMDVMGDVAWHQTSIVQAQKSTGKWYVRVERPGTYRFGLRRWPAEIDLPLAECVSEEDARSHIYAPPDIQCQAIHPTSARLKLFDQEQTQSVSPGDQEATFLMDSPAGVTQMEAWFMGDTPEEQQGAYYVYVERLP